MARKAGADGKRPDFPVVGIGASAGGIPALKRFFSSARPTATSPMSSSCTSPPGARACSATPSAASARCRPPSSTAPPPSSRATSTSSPPTAALTLRTAISGRAARHGGGPRSPVDGFLTSLATERGESAACVILSGTGSDGTLGLRAIKEHGGLALAQAAAEYDGMTRSAVATGLVDFVLPAEAMPGEAP